MTFSDAVFWVFAVIAVLPALAILFVRGIVRMAFLLLFSLAGFAGLYLQLGAGFLGFTQVLIYIGGILILFLFGLMLTARMDLPVRERAGPGLVIPGALAGLVISAFLLVIAVGNPWKEVPPRLTQAPASDGSQLELRDPDTRAIGYKLMSTYLLPFEAVSVLLLVAMVGATYIARAKEEPAEAASEP